MLDDDVDYYRIVYQDDGTLAAIEMSRQDEWDYDRSLFLTARTYADKAEALRVIGQLELLLYPQVTRGRVDLLRQVAGAI